MRAGDTPDAARSDRIVERLAEQRKADVRLVLASRPEIRQPESFGWLLARKGRTHGLGRFRVGFDADSRSLREGLAIVALKIVVHVGP